MRTFFNFQKELSLEQMKKELNGFFVWQLQAIRQRAALLPVSPKGKPVVIPCDICENKIRVCDLEYHFDICKKLWKTEQRLNGLITQLQSSLFQVYRLNHVTKIKVQIKR